MKTSAPPDFFDFSKETLDVLRETVRAELSESRFRHVAAVESMIVRLGTLYLPQDLPKLRGAALLHDLTKEFSNEKQEKILASHGILLSDTDRLFPMLYHAETAALTIPERFPALADPAVVTAVKHHTAGGVGMTTFSLLLFLADYIDESRTYGDCVMLRDDFFGQNPSALSTIDRMRLLYDTVTREIELTVAHLLRKGSPIHPDTVRMRNDLILRKAAL